jgi:hypothetical protein
MREPTAADHVTSPNRYLLSSLFRSVLPARTGGEDMSGETCRFESKQPVSALASTTTHSHDVHSHEHSHSHDHSHADEHGHTHEVLEHPGKFAERDL